MGGMAVSPMRSAFTRDVYFRMRSHWSFVSSQEVICAAAL